MRYLNDANARDLLFGLGLSVPNPKDRQQQVKQQRDRQRGDQCFTVDYEFGSNVTLKM